MSISNLEFIFLGTGTSAGIPIIACNCEVCLSKDPHDKRTRCGAALRFVDGNNQPRILLIDATPDLRQQVLRHQFERCDGIIFTHNHVDHLFGLDDVRRFNAVMQAPIDIYADGHTMETLHRVYRHIFEREKNVNDSFVATLIPHLLDADHTFNLFGLQITPLPLLHGRLPILGFRIDRAVPPATSDSQEKSNRMDNHPVLPLAYCTDVSSIPPETWPKLTGLRTLVLDMLRYRQHPTHFTVDQALEAASRIGAEKTYFTHMTHEILHADLDSKLPPNTQLAFDGLVLSQ